jgi:DNA-binding GntR family transcriptional regulator
MIVTGQIAPGTRLIETDVAERMAVSRTPAREALRRLAHEGLARVVRAGTKTHLAVAPATVVDLLDLFAIIGALEGVAGRGVERLTAAERRRLANELADLNERFASRVSRRLQAPEQFFASHDAFHERLVDRGASERLKRLIATVRPQVKRYELLYATAVGSDFGPSLREHRRIIAAVRTGQAAQVEQAVRLNWSNSAFRLSAGVATSPLGALGTFGDAS